MQSGARPGQCGSPVAGACPRPSRRRRLALARRAAPVFTEHLSQSFLGRPSVPVGARVLSSVAAAACRPRSPCGQGEPRPRPLLRDLCVGREPSARDSWPDLAQGAPESPRAARSVPAPCVPAIFRGGGVRASRPSAVLGPGLRPRLAAASAHRGARGARGLASVVPRRRWVSVTSPARSQIRAGCWEEATRRRHGRVLCSSRAGRAAFPQHAQCGRSSGARGAVCRAVARPCASRSLAVSRRES